MAINTNPTFAPGQRLTPEQLAQMLALRNDPQFVSEGDAGPVMTSRGGSVPGKFGPGIAFDPAQVTRGTGVGADAEVMADPSGAGRWLISQPRNTSTWGNNDTTDVWDEQGNYVGTSTGQTAARGLATVLASAAGGAYANGGFGAGSLSGGATAGTTAASGMSGSELASFLEANGGALAPGGEVAAGYGTTWGVGADGVIGQGATMLADGSQIDPWKLDEPYRDEGNNYRTPQGDTGQPNSPANSPSTPPNPPGSTPPPKGGDTPWTLRDTTQLISGGVRVANSLTDGGSGGGSGDPATDQALLDRQLRALDSQEALMQRIIGNADMVMPFQREAMDFGLRTAKEAYGDYRDDRTYALGRRNELTGLQDQAVREARDFNTEAKREELAGMASADVQRAFSNARDQGVRSMTRMGVNPNDPRFGSQVRQLITDQTLAQAAAANGARRGARNEGRALTDRAAGFLSGAPALATQATGGGAAAGTAPVGIAANSLTAMNSGLATANNAAGSLTNATTGVVNSQRNTNQNSGTDWGGYGALIGGLAKAYDVWGG